jgi:hypothetical protein
MKITGKIEAKEKKGEGAGVKGAWERWVFKIGGKDYSTFDKKIYMFFQVGDEVEIETKTEGKYENMVSMKKSEPGAPDELVLAIQELTKAIKEHGNTKNTN